MGTNSKDTDGVYCRSQQARSACRAPVPHTPPASPDRTSFNPAQPNPTSPRRAPTRPAATGCARLLPILLLTVASAPSLAYEPAIHQKLTFIAAKQLSRCLADTEVPELNALQVRIIAKANTRQADANLFVRMFRWNYYDRSGVGDRDILWVIDTRFHKHFNEVVQRIEAAQVDNDRYRDLGRVVGYVQEVTSPPHAVPVYATRWWRFAFRDRFDRYPVDEAGVARLVEDSCAAAMATGPSYHAVLETAARDTLAAVQAPITGLPVSWEVFWTPHENPGRFGSYGPAGNNFGQGARFPCGQVERCVLLRDDPLYAEFALRRHAAAVLASMRAILRAQGFSGEHAAP